ncbi:hypothetical protein Mapa_013461 [Marchantia paleacea]|nr:hypothetical protein Mapa_013461 [Marchantia paleacea]
MSRLAPYTTKAGAGRQASEKKILILVFAISLCKCAWSLSDVLTTPQDYSLEHGAGSIAGLFCALIDDPNPYQCESEVWVSYSVSLGMSMDLCGKCIQITNTADGGGSVKACILDMKQADGLDLDLPGFHQIDNASGNGHFDGHMRTNVEFVNC